MPSVLALLASPSLCCFSFCLYDRHDHSSCTRSFPYIFFSSLDLGANLCAYHISHAFPSHNPPTPTRPLFTFIVPSCFVHCLPVDIYPSVPFVLVVYEAVMEYESIRSTPKSLRRCDARVDMPHQTVSPTILIYSLSIHRRKPQSTRHLGGCNPTCATSVGTYASDNSDNSP